MKKKRLIPTKRKRIKDKQLADMLTIQLTSMIDELHKHKNGSVSVSDLTKHIEYKKNNKKWY